MSNHNKALARPDNRGVPSTQPLPKTRLARAEEAELARRAKRGDRAARDRLAASVGGIATQQASAMWARSRARVSSRAEFADCVQAAHIGVMEAVATFDPKRGKRLTTHAYPYVKRALSTWLREEALTDFRLPAPAAQRLYAAHAGEGEEEQWMARASRPSLSLDADIEVDGTREEFHTTLSEADVEGAASDAEREEVEALHRAVDHLPEPHRSIIRDHFGLDGWYVAEATGRPTSTHRRGYGTTAAQAATAAGVELDPTRPRGSATDLVREGLEMLREVLSPGSGEETGSVGEEES